MNRYIPYNVFHCRYLFFTELMPLRYQINQSVNAMRGLVVMQVKDINDSVPFPPVFVESNLINYV